jgi:hypothetical protein
VRDEIVPASVFRRRRRRLGGGDRWEEEEWGCKRGRNKQ